ncbi:choice-of-anchor P family protein [Amycolatopsis sp. CA-230715]|uniref:choice-of-anchor P family protein n=1 Tax=Amycolatopsis sp. CA-230715 TaxID=2745196 RepID=UPI001C0136D5|nr:choice-of-anchor P family protein [Amycolatopsis sp. CA-230715]QWF79596.1 hypothetical protein HUW46_03005 [Amycolatopsis sp. CA-230715]
MKTHLRRGGLLAAVVACVALVGAGTAAAAPGDGSAYGLSVNVKLLGADAVKAGPFAAASTNGPTQNTFAGVNLPGILTSGVINTEAKRDDNSGQVDAKASTANVGLPLLKAALGNVGAKAIEATCVATQKGVTGSSTLVGANFGSLGSIPVTPAANTKLEVKIPVIGNVATVILNEQIKNPDGSLTVNALHVKLLGSDLAGAIGSGDVVISSATCGPAGLPVPLASGAGMWIGFGLLGAIAVPVGIRVTRNRRASASAAA